MTVLNYLRETSGAPAPRRAAPRAIAAPAPWCSARSTARASLIAPSIPASSSFPASTAGSSRRSRIWRRRTATLHPVQQAMVENTARNAASARRASSCRSSPCFTRARSAERRAGAASTMRWPAISAAAPVTARSSPPRPGCRTRGRDQFDASEAATIRALRALQAETVGSIETADGRRWFAPRRVEALAELLLRFPDACLVAGATDVGLWVTKQHRRLDP